MVRSMRIGTRGSPLALAQAHETRRKIAASQRIAEEAIEIIVIKTSGDMIQDRALSEAGGKGLFTRELDIAMLENRIDIAVHSSKDLPTVLPDGIVVAGYLPREDVRDALICNDARTIADLPKDARIGTASLRRAAQMKRLRHCPCACCTAWKLSTSAEIPFTKVRLGSLKRAAWSPLSAFPSTPCRNVICSRTRRASVRPPLLKTCWVIPSSAVLPPATGSSMPLWPT